MTDQPVRHTNEKCDPVARGVFSIGSTEVGTAYVTVIPDLREKVLAKVRRWQEQFAQQVLDALAELERDLTPTAAIDAAFEVGQWWVSPTGEAFVVDTVGPLTLRFVGSATACSPRGLFTTEEKILATWTLQEGPPEPSNLTIAVAGGWALIRDDELARRHGKPAARWFLGGAGDGYEWREGGLPAGFYCNRERDLRDLRVYAMPQIGDDL